MYLIFTTPIQFTNSYTLACNIADAHYQSTGEIVAVELSQCRCRFLGWDDTLEW